MNSRSSTEWQADFTEARRDLAQWRESRKRGARIPSELWRSAVELAGKHGVSKTSLVLGLDYYALKKRLKAELEELSEQPQAGPVKGVFVEIPRTPASGAWSLELGDDRGTRLRVEAQGSSVTDLAALAHSLWSAAR